MPLRGDPGKIIGILLLRTFSRYAAMHFGFRGKSLAFLAKNLLPLCGDAFLLAPIEISITAMRRCISPGSHRNLITAMWRCISLGSYRNLIAA